MNMAYTVLYNSWLILSLLLKHYLVIFAAPTPTPMSVEKLPLFTLNCSSLDNLWGTLDWTRSRFDVDHTNIEVVCLRGEKKVCLHCQVLDGHCILINWKVHVSCCYCRIQLNAN